MICALLYSRDIYLLMVFFGSLWQFKCDFVLFFSLFLVILVKYAMMFIRAFPFSHFVPRGMVGIVVGRVVSCLMSGWSCHWD